VRNVWILFGERSKIEDAVKVSFKTEAEILAYLKGVNDAVGWSGWYQGDTKAELRDAVVVEEFNEP